MADHIDWPGQSGRTYRYWFLNMSGGIKAEPGNYMFVKELANYQFVPVYIGQASDLSARLPNHERWADAKRAGATHVMAHTNSNEKARTDEEQDLIARWQPVLNTHHKEAR